jgi:hypothetical protein
MPSHDARRYFFVLQGVDWQHTDPHGTLLWSDADALAYARRIVRELREAGGYDDPQLKLIVRNSKDDVIHIVPF